jgi:hypothetical protein
MGEWPTRNEQVSGSSPLVGSLFGIGRSNYPRKVRFQKFRLSGLWFLILKALRAAERKRNGKDSNRSAAIADS